jgi:hypothetical protein
VDIPQTNVAMLSARWLQQAHKLSGAPVGEGDERCIGIVAIVCGYISITASMRDEIVSTLLAVSPGGAHAGRYADQFTPQA